MTTNDPAAREAAENILDGMFRVLDDMTETPMEERFDLLVVMLLRSNASRTVLAAALVTAMERLRVREQLDEHLSEG